MSVLTSPPSTPRHNTINPTTACPSCGTRVPISFPSAALSPGSETQARILELEAQVRLLNGKAVAAADKLADYEDEVRFLRAVHARKEQQQNGGTASGGGGGGGGVRESISSFTRAGSPPGDADANGGPPRPPQASRLSSFSAYLPMGRRGTSGPAMPPPSPGLHADLLSSSASASTSTPNLLTFSSAEASSLRQEIAHEKTLRQAAESTLSQSQRELEDLTAQLFSQANEMVATERRARAKLEERVRVLETRDGEKRRRLERLEGAVQRIERVKGMVG